MCRNRLAGVVLVVASLGVLTLPQAQGAQQFQTVGKAGEWTISGKEGHCQAGKPHRVGQFAVGIVAEGTFLMFQDLSWSLPSTPNNMMPVEILLDDAAVFRTEALVIGQVRSFQVFLWLTETPGDVFWKRFLNATSLGVTGKFKPGRAEVDLTDTKETIPLLRKCAEQFLPDVELPF